MEKVTNTRPSLIEKKYFIGLGFGLLLPSGFTAVHDYFEKKENLAISICQTIIAGMGMAWPVLMSYLMRTYGFRGTVAILSALTLHLVAAAVMFQPGKLHYKRVPINAVELEMCISKLYLFSYIGEY